MSVTRTRDPFGQALEAIRRACADGRYAPGRPVVISDEALALRLSTTPVREALCWLGGEGLVERGGAGGFFAPRLEAGVLAQRYGFRRLCLLQTTMRMEGPPPPGLLPGTAADRLVPFWRWRLRSLGDVALLQAFDQVQGHLARFSAAERRLFNDVEAEAAALMEATPEQAPALVVAYHERRMALAPVLVLNAEADAADSEAGN